MLAQMERIHNELAQPKPILLLLPKKSSKADVGRRVTDVVEQDRKVEAPPLPPQTRLVVVPELTDISLSSLPDEDDKILRETHV